MKKIGILTSGGDCSGMNAAIRSAVRSGLRNNVEMLGFRKGYVGLMKPDYITLDSKAVSGILHRGGTFLQSARSPEFRTIEGQQQALANLKNLGVEGLIILGGDGSLTGALALHNLGFPVIGIPASIDNDIPYTDMALGVDTALNNIIYAVDCIKDTASSHARAFVIEVMGRNSGYLASISAIAAGAEYAWFRNGISTSPRYASSYAPATKKDGITPSSSSPKGRATPTRSPTASRTPSASKPESRCSATISGAAHRPSSTGSWRAVWEKMPLICSWRGKRAHGGSLQQLHRHQLTGGCGQGGKKAPRRDAAVGGGAGDIDGEHRKLNKRRAGNFFLARFRLRQLRL